jgi:hypothetical protein
VITNLCVMSPVLVVFWVLRQKGLTVTCLVMNKFVEEECENLAYSAV